MDGQIIRDTLTKNGLKITPQRTAVLKAIHTMGNHPDTEQIIEFIKGHHPNVAIGTIYKILDTFVAKGIINMVKTDRDKMRYDAVSDLHHHLYCSETSRIEDYYDEELNQIITNYFSEKEIPDFDIEDIKLQIKGKFLKNE